MRVKIGQGKESVEISDDLYHYLADNFCSLENRIYLESIEKDNITFTQLRVYARSLNIPYSLFFGNYNQVKAMVDIQNRQLFGALDGKYIIGTRGRKVDIRSIRFIILDAVSKQKVYKRYGNAQRLDHIVKRLSSSKRSAKEQANYVIQELNIDRDYFWKISSKREALKYLRQRLSDNHIHVAIEARNYMPQNLPENLGLSGVYVRDNFNPYIFICNELSGEPDEGSGRKIYTLVFLLVCIFKGKSYAVSISKDGYKINHAQDKSMAKIHDITNEILMPSEEIERMTIENFDAIKNYAQRLNVTPRALIERLYKLGRIENEYEAYKELASESFQKSQIEYKLKTSDSGGPRKHVMISYYQGDFINFIRTNVPKNLQDFIFDRHVRYKRIGVSLEQL